MNVLLTGGAGYIGSHTSFSLIDEGHNVTIIDNLINGNKKLVPKKAKLCEFDISDVAKVSNLVKKNNFDIIIHFAAFTRVAESVKNPEKYLNNNFEKSKIFVDTCIDNEINHIIFSSTGAVYGNTKKNIIKETDNTDPLNPYSESKLKFEKYLYSLNKKKKISAYILRYFNVSGADEKLRSGLITNPDNLIKAVCEVATNKREKLIINGNDYKTKDGTAVRDFIHVSDLSQMHLIAAKKLLEKSNNSFEIFNCGYGDGYSVNEVVSEMKKIVNKKFLIEYGPRRTGDAECSIANVEKFKKFFSWSPKFNNLNLILRSSLKWEDYWKNI